MEPLRTLLLDLIDDALSHTFLVRGEQRHILMALRDYTEAMTPSDLQRFKTCLDAIPQRSFGMDNEHAEMKAQADAVGMPGGLILTLIATFGPTIAQLLIELFKKQKEVQGVGAPGDAQAFKSLLLRVIDLAEMGAKLTPTEVDDKAIGVVKGIVANTELVEFVFQLLGK
jgi:hypothetical protein